MTEDEIEQEEQEKEQARLKANAIRRARYANRTADEKEQARLVVNQKYAVLQANRTKAEARSRANMRRLLANSVDCDHCGRPYPSRGNETSLKSSNIIAQFGLECKQISKRKKSRA